MSMSMPIVRMRQVQSMGRLVLDVVVDFADGRSAFDRRFAAVFVFRSHARFPARQRGDLDANLAELGGHYFATTRQ